MTTSPGVGSPRAYRTFPSTSPRSPNGQATLLIPVEIQAQLPAQAGVCVGELGDHQCVLADIGGEHKAAPFTHHAGTKLAVAANMARQQGIPLVCHLNSTGAPADGGVEALHGWGTAARELARCSGVVPILFCVRHSAVAGSALLIGLADVVVMVADSYAYVSGPRTVQEYTGVPIDNSTLGGAGRHATTSGVAHFVANTATEADEIMTEVLDLLPPNADQPSPRLQTSDPVVRKLEGIAEVLPTSVTGSYDVRTIATEVVDDGVLTELRAGWAANLVTAFGRIGGETVGIVANQPQSLAGTLDIAASQKGAQFVALCDAFNIALVTFVDTPGFQPGKDLEWRGMIRHGAQLAFAYARATVPRICVTLRKSYGGAYIVMDSKYMGNDIALAWPSAEIAVMGAKGAVEILHRGASETERAELELEYEDRLLNPYVAAERGSVDMVIRPEDTRTEIASALQALASKRERLPRRHHDNSPL